MRAFDGNIPPLKLLDFTLRLLVIPLSISSIWLTVTNQQDNSTYGKLGFSNLKSLKYMLVAYLLVTSGAAVMEILYLAYNGDRKVTWSEACSSYGSFCNRLMAALVLHALTLGCFFVLAVISAYRVFSLFEPPLPSKEVEEQTT